MDIFLVKNKFQNVRFVFQKNRGQSGGIPGLDLNVEAAWAMGFTGKGVTTAIMDDGRNLCVQIWSPLHCGKISALESK